MANALPFDRSQQLYILKPDVDPQAAVHPERFRAARLKQEQQRDEPAVPDKNLWEELPREDLLTGVIDKRDLHRVALTTDAGLGKSYNLEWLNYELNDRTRRQRAFLLPIGELTSAADLIANNLVPRVRDAAGNNGEDRQRLHAELDLLRHRGRLTLLFDGLDMAGDANVEVLAQLLDPQSDWKHCRIVVAGRPFALERHWSQLFAAKPWHFVQIAEFSAEQQKRALGKLPNGQDRYDKIPPDARNILTIPRVLEYLKPLDENKLEQLHTVADVYWQAANYMLRQALGRNVDVLTWQRYMALLGALAFTMYAQTERHEKTNELHPNLDRVDALDMPDFLNEALGRLEEALPRYNEDKLNKDLPELSRLNTLLNHGWFDVMNVGGVGEDLLWRNASLQEFFAAYWVARWGKGTDIQCLRDWVVDPLTKTNQGFYWFWRYASEMPDEAILPGRKKPPTSWQNAMSLLYNGSVRDDQNRPIRSTEFLYRTWQRMEGTDARTMFSEEFARIRAGEMGRAKENIADQTLAGFIPLVNSGKEGDTGMFMMGAPEGEDDWDVVDGAQDNPLHEVTLSPFRMHQFCVTNEEYELFDARHIDHRWLGEKHPLQKNEENRGGDAHCPVVNVSWYDAWCFAAWLGTCGDKKGEQFRIVLPTEAQWEYACRAGRDTPFTFAADHDDQTCTSDVCNFYGISPWGEGAKEGEDRDRTIPVDELGPNPWGFYQMHGNVLEWCQDWYAAEFYRSEQGNQPDPCNDATASIRVLRGGSWFDFGRDCRSAARNRFTPDDRYDVFGFRLAAVPVGAKSGKQGSGGQAVVRSGAERNGGTTA